jgi:hypothetical protein
VTSPPDRPTPEAFLPARRTPFLYLGFAHVCLFTALLLLGLRVDELGGFYYHPRLIAVVHLVTLGFITSAILGALYLVGPLAFRLSLPEGRGDVVAALSWMIGVSGVATHFWIERYPGMAWSGGMALTAAAWVGGRVLRALPRAPVPLEARLPVGLALLNLYLAGGLGVMLGINKHHPFLPTSQLDAVHAHLHLAAVGFATLMVVGVGYRMLPMVLPSAMPKGPAALASGILVEAGTLGLAASLLFVKAAVLPSALVVVAGLGLFASRLVFMLRNRRPAPPARPKPDWALFHVAQAFAYLGLAVGLGLALAVLPRSDLTLRLAFAYGVCGLLGFLAQLVLGVEARLVPLAAWLQSFADGGYGAQPPSPHRVAPPFGAAASVVLWTVGVPCLGFGLATDRTALASQGAWLMAAGVAITAGSGVVALRRLGR